MGFIDWHGNKQDQYEDILEFAKMKERMEADNFGSQMKKKADAKFFGVPELLSMESDEILKLLLKEKKGLDILYDSMVQNAPIIEQLHINSDMTQQFYDDFLRYSMDVLFQQTKIEEDRAHQFVDVILNRVFKVNNQISINEHYLRIETSEEYRQYLSRGFELKSGNVTLFWQWIRYIAELSAKNKEGTQFIKLYQRFMAHLSYYINQLIPDTDVGKKYIERRKINTEILQKSVSTKIDVANIDKNIRNPIFLIHKEEERKRQEAETLAAKMAEEATRVAVEEDARRRAEAEARRRIEIEEAERKKQEEFEAEARRKRFLSLMKCARIILGYYNLDIEDESDMITAGRLYTAIKEKNIKLERMISIFPAECAGLVERSILPVVSKDDVQFKLNERELLHYVEYVTIYMQGADEDTIIPLQGTLFITNQKIQIETGKKVFSIPYEYLKKAVIYDVMPEIIEFASSRDNYFIRTADTELTYRIMKMILGYWSEIEQQSDPAPMNMEQMTIGFLEKEDMESYIFGIKTMMDVDMPENLQTDLVEMIRSLEFLDIALKKYPSYKEQSYNFFSYYIPEAVKILYAYNEYEKAGLEEREINPVYEKVVAAIQKLSVAAKQQVVDIYKNAIVDTTARAEALAEILGQDGFVDSAYKINI